MLHKKLSIKTNGQGLYEVTREINAFIRSSKFEEGLCNIFLQHTSASLVIQENADSSARKDLEGWMKRLVPENDKHFTHTSEGPDDMPSHIKAALTATSLVIPVISMDLALGTWQGVYLWEHRDSAHQRTLLIGLI